MNKYLVILFRYILLTFILFFLGLQSCADLSSDPNQNANQNNSKIQIFSPVSKSTISTGMNSILYNIAQPYSIKFIELYVNNIFKKNIPPNANGTLPSINFDIDTTYIGKTIDLFLIYYDNDGTSQKSNIISELNVTKDNRIPFKPYNISLINFNDGSCNISWKDSSQYVDKYELWRKIDFAGEYVLNQELNGNSFNTNDDGLDSNKIYFYKLRGLKSSGTSEFSEEVNTKGILTSGNLYPPTNLTVTLLDISVVTLNWIDNSDNENYFVIERSIDNINYNRIAALSKNTTFYKDSGSGLITGSTYHYRVKSFSNTDSAISNTIMIRITSNILLPPTNLIANYDSTIGVIKLNWLNNDNNILYIDIERKTENTNFTLLKRINAGSIPYLDFSVTANQIYTYRIRGFDLNTYSEYSNEATISTY